MLPPAPTRRGAETDAAAEADREGEGERDEGRSEEIDRWKKRERDSGKDGGVSEIGRRGARKTAERIAARRLR